LTGWSHKKNLQENNAERLKQENFCRNVNSEITLTSLEAVITVSKGLQNYLEYLEGSIKRIILNNIYCLYS